MFFSHSYIDKTSVISFVQSHRLSLVEDAFFFPIMYIILFLKKQKNPLKMWSSKIKQKKID